MLHVIAFWLITVSFDHHGSINCLVVNLSLKPVMHKHKEPKTIIKSEMELIEKRIAVIKGCELNWSQVLGHITNKHCSKYQTSSKVPLRCCDWEDFHPFLLQQDSHRHSDSKRKLDFTQQTLWTDVQQSISSEMHFQHLKHRSAICSVFCFPN